MALHLLLDEHVSPDVVRALQRAQPKIRATALRDWGSGMYLGVPDDALLAAAFQESLALVTNDRRTIVPLLAQLAESDISHAGVILVDERTIAQNDIGGLDRALVSVWNSLHRADWTNRVIYLAP